MSVHTQTSSLAPRRRGSIALTREIAARGDLAAALALALGFAVAVALTWNAWGDLAHDTGYDLLAAQRVADGQLPYADFPYVYGPLGLGLLGAAFAAFGASTGTAVAVGVLVAAAAVALTYALARQVTGIAGATVAAALTTVAAVGTGNMGLIMPHAMAASVAVVLSLAGLLAAARFAAAGKRSRLVWAGVATGLVALTRPEFLAALVFALAAWLSIRIVRAEGAERRAAVRDALAWIAPTIAIPAVVYGAFLTQVSPGELINDNLFPRDQLAAGSDDVLRASAPLTASSFAKLLGELLLYAAGAAVLVVAGRLGARHRRAVLLVAAGAAALVVLVTIARPEVVRSRLGYAFEWIPAGAAIALVLVGAAALRSRRALSEWTARDQVALMSIAFLAVLAAKTYAAFAAHPNPIAAQFATYALPFAAVFLAWLHLEVLPRGHALVRTLGIGFLAAVTAACVVLVIGDGRDERLVVRGPGGAMAAQPEDGVAYQQAVDAIVSRTKPGEPIFLAPQSTALYVLSGRTNPLRELSLLPGTLPTEGAQADAIARMKSVRLAITDRRELSEYGQGAFGETFDQRLGAWLRTDFRRVATYHGAAGSGVILDLWQRSATP
jgi:hypothetical protein